MTAFVCGLLFSSPASSRTITLDVDATQAPQKILHVKLVIPVQPGPLTLLYPKWVPGTHGPFGPIVNVAGPIITADGKPLVWRRDPRDMYAIGCDIPPGSSTIEVTFDYLIPGNEATATAKLAVINWNQVLFYPRGDRPEDLKYSASIRLPDGWRFGTALPIAGQSGNTVRFEPVPLDALIDSPLNAGFFFRRISLAPNVHPPHELDIAADSEKALEVPASALAGYTRLVGEATALFGKHPYRQYRFLVSLSDQFSPAGIEHHQSSDIRLLEESFVEDKAHRLGSILVLPHEFAHSWNGKHRRPANMITVDYQQPEETELLWVYEGLTQYLAHVLAGRAGLLTLDEEREGFASMAAALDRPRPGRQWRTLADTATAAQLGFSPGYSEWVGWRRKLDFYWEGPLIWLEADIHIRQQTSGHKSLDDFIREFFGDSDSPTVEPYTLNDLIASLNLVAPWDWKSFFAARVDQITKHPPLRGIEDGGWRLVYNDEINQWDDSFSQTQQRILMLDTLGLSLASDGTILDTVPGMPAVKAGVGPGMKLLAVNGRVWTAARLRDAVKSSAGSKQPIALLLQNGDYVNTYMVDYHDGERQPHLVRDDSKPDLLDSIFAPRTARAKKSP